MKSSISLSFAARLCALTLLITGAQCVTTHPTNATTQGEYQKMLAEYLDLPASQILVRAESKTTHVTFTGITDAVHREGIEDCLATLNENNPQMNPMKWQFR